MKLSIRRLFLIMRACLIGIIAGLLLAFTMDLPERVEAGVNSEPKYPDCPSIARFEGHSFSHPPVLLEGQQIEVSIHAQAKIDDIEEPLGQIMVLVALDRSENQESVKDVKRLVSEIAKTATAPHYRAYELGIVNVANRVNILASLTDDQGRLERAVSRISTGDLGLFEDGIREAHRQFPLFRPTCKSPFGPHQVLIVIASESGISGCPAAIRRSRQIKRDSILVSAVCASRKCNLNRCFSDIASSRRYLFGIEDGIRVLHMLDRFRNLSLGPAVPDFRISQQLGTDVEYQTDSAEPPAVWSDDGSTLTWDFNHVPRKGITVAYQVKPMREGTIRIGKETRFDWTDRLNRKGSKILPEAVVLVLGRPE